MGVWLVVRPKGLRYIVHGLVHSPSTELLKMGIAESPFSHGLGKTAQDSDTFICCEVIKEDVLTKTDSLTVFMPTVP